MQLDEILSRKNFYSRIFPGSNLPLERRGTSLEVIRLRVLWELTSGNRQVTEVGTKVREKITDLSIQIHKVFGNLSKTRILIIMVVSNIIELELMWNV